MVLKKSTDKFNLIRLNRKLFPIDEFDITKNLHFWLYYDGRKSVGFCCLKDIGYGLAYLYRAGVEEEYENRGLHKKMIKSRVAWARKNNFKEVITYVHYENPLSLRNLIKCGFEVYIPEWNYAGDYFIYLKKSL